MKDEIVVEGVRYVRAYDVAEPRCPACGIIPPIWTPGRIVRALQAHEAKHGRGPKEIEWERSTPEHPNFEVVRRIFGSFRRGLAVAGVRGVVWRGSWTRQAVIDAILDWHFEHGRPPKTKDWKGGQERRYPSEKTVRDHFGTWNRGIAAAGLTPSQRGSRYATAPTEERERKVDAAPIVPFVRAYVAEGGSQSTLAEISGVDEAVIGRLFRGTKAQLFASTVDRILVALDRPDIWYSEYPEVA